MATPFKPRADIERLGANTQEIKIEGGRLLRNDGFDNYGMTVWVDIGPAKRKGAVLEVHGVVGKEQERRVLVFDSAKPNEIILSIRGFNEELSLEEAQFVVDTMLEAIKRKRAE